MRRTQTHPREVVQVFDKNTADRVTKNRVQTFGPQSFMSLEKRFFHSFVLKHCGALLAQVTTD